MNKMCPYDDPNCTYEENTYYNLFKSFFSLWFFTPQNKCIFCQSGEYMVKAVPYTIV